MSESDDIRVTIRTGTSERAPVYRPTTVVPIILQVSIYPESPSPPEDWLEMIIRNSMEQESLYRDDNIELILGSVHRLSFEEMNHDEYRGDCCICQKSYTIEDEVAELECKHVFHYACIREWGKYKQECPQCRNPIAATVV